MVFWICVGLVAAALGLVLVLLLELRAKQRRLEAAIAQTRPQVRLANEIVGALQSIRPPHRSADEHRRTGPTGTSRDPALHWGCPRD